MVTGLVRTPDMAVVAQRSIAGSRAHNEALVPSVQECLDEAGVSFGDLDAVVAGVGPGPFTGLRVGMVSAQAIGQALGIPVFGVCTHDAIAADAAGTANRAAADTAAAGTAAADRSVLVVTDARRREVYWSAYRGGRRVAGPDVCAPGQIPARGEVVVAAESVRGKLELGQGGVDTRDAVPTPAGLVAVADLDARPEPLVPLYLRRPDAVAPSLVVSPAVPAVEL